jgi:hypothetical protein
MATGDLRRRINATTYRALYWGQNHVAPGMRSLIGFMFMVGGVFGFLPILGFWMFPLGVAFVALDLPLARDRIDTWMGRLAEHAGLTHIPLAERQRARRSGAEPRSPTQVEDDEPTSSQ